MLKWPVLSIKINKNYVKIIDLNRLVLHHKHLKKTK